MNQKLFVLGCFLVFLCQTPLNAEERVGNELRAPAKGAAPLEIFLPKGVKPQLEVVADYSGYRCELTDDKTDEPLATLTVYIGQNPPQLSNLVKTNKFLDQTVYFHDERTTWFSWIAGEGEKQRCHAVAYLYNIYTTQPNRENPYVVQVYVEGRDIEAINSLKVAAQTIRAKR